MSGSNVAIVTGASSGIGEATALRFARAGFTVVVVARRTSLLDTLVSRIRAAGGEALAVAADLADEAATREVAARTLDAHGKVDVLVNNAGYGPPGPLERMSRSALRHAFEVNLFGGAQLVSELAPAMRAAGGGRVVNVSSLAAFVAAPFASAYAGTKGALEAMTDCLRLELAPSGISLTLVIPGFVHTPTFEKSKEAAKPMRADPTNPYRAAMSKVEAFADSQLERTGIPPDDVAKVILRAATERSPRARYYVPGSAWVAASAFGVLPSGLADRLLRKMYGVG